MARRYPDAVEAAPGGWRHRPDAMADEFLPRACVLYFHDPGLQDWSTESYVKMSEVSTVGDFATAATSITPDVVRMGMFFLMREGVMPTWDDPHNIDGGCYSIRVSGDEIHRSFMTLCFDVLAEEVMLETEGAEFEPLVTGVSVSPKNNFSVVKVWTSSKIPTDQPPWRMQALQAETMFKHNRAQQESAAAAPSTRGGRHGSAPPRASKMSV